MPTEINDLNDNITRCKSEIEKNNAKSKVKEIEIILSEQNIENTVLEKSKSKIETKQDL